MLQFVGFSNTTDIEEWAPLHLENSLVNPYLAHTLQTLFQNIHNLSQPHLLISIFSYFHFKTSGEKFSKQTDLTETIFHDHEIWVD